MHSISTQLIPHNALETRNTTLQRPHPEAGRTTEKFQTTCLFLLDAGASIDFTEKPREKRRPVLAVEKG